MDALLRGAYRCTMPQVAYSALDDGDATYLSTKTQTSSIGYKCNVFGMQGPRRLAFRRNKSYVYHPKASTGAHLVSSGFNFQAFCSQHRFHPACPTRAYCVRLARREDIPVLTVSDWSVVRIYPRLLRHLPLDV
eukprot:1354515-Pyramimonas_sp.AAC.1